MHPNVPNKRGRIVLARESYVLNGIFYRIHNRLGRFLLEKQYGDALEAELNKLKIPHEREKRLAVRYERSSIPVGTVDFLVDGKIAVDVKAKKMITKDDYFQMLRYLKACNLELGMIVNFRSTYLKPKRVLNSSFKKDSDNSDAAIRIIRVA